MKLGIMACNGGQHAFPDEARRLVDCAEQLGYESLWTGDHAVIPKDYESRYPYSRGQKMSHGDQTVAIADPLVWMAYVAGVTSKLRLGTGVLLLANRNPIIVAKEAASLDVLSGGRLLMGVGVGWLREEAQAVGVPVGNRGKRLDEYMRALRVLWAEEAPTFEGEFTSFSEAYSFPRPIQTGGVPLLVGGHSPAAARRAGRLGDGFYPLAPDPEDLPGLIDIMTREAVDAGRDPQQIELTCRAPRTEREAEIMLDLGVSRVLVNLPRSDDVEAHLAAEAARVREQLAS